MGVAYQLGFINGRRRIPRIPGLVIRYTEFYSVGSPAMQLSSPPVPSSHNQASGLNIC
jgi:hypothetical protein